MTTNLKLGLAAAVALVVGISLGFLTLTIMRGADHDAENATAALMAGFTAVQRTANAYAGADRLSEITAAARTAAAGDDAVGRTSGSLPDKIEDPAFRTQVVQALTAQRELLRALAQAASLTDRTLDKWPTMRDRARASLDSMSAAWTTVSATQEFEQPLPKDPARAVSGAVSEVDAYLRNGRRRMTRWERKRNAAIREHKAELAVLDSYGSSMRSYLNQYSTLRNEMSDWIAKVDSEGVTFQEAYDFLGDASLARTRVLQGVKALDSPQALASAHNTVISVIADAVGAVEAASQGTSDYQFDFDDEYAEYRDAPGWKHFSAASETISDRYAAAKSAWETGFKKARTRVLERGLPARPKI